ncbi:MAG: Hsp70 family protein [Verrucomicrobiota bacterium]
MGTTEKFVGIDLGTTTSGLAWVKPDGSPEIVPNGDGERLTPSVVYFDKYEKVKLVGSSARDGGDPSRTIFRIKDHMDDPDYVIDFDGEKWTPTEISALILAKLKRECERIIGDFEEVVITVPANFNELARTATINAAQIAGLKVKRLVNEPTAAALYYASTQDIEGRVLVYDMGGGTLDITILEIAKDKVNILGSEGARRLGGNNFDDLLLAMYAEQYTAIAGAPLYGDERERRRCLQLVEDAKKMLSKLKTVTDTVGNRQVGLARIELTRDVFEEAVQRYLTRTIMLIEQALAGVSLTEKDIDHVVLVGGSTRIPKVREVLTKHFGYAPKSCGNVDECVALGAALFSKNDREIQEVCNQSYGILALVEDQKTKKSAVKNSIIIKKNRPIPCSESQTYETSEDNETLIEVDVTQGEDDDPAYVDVIGRLALKVPSGRPAGCDVKVTYHYDRDQRVKAMVLDEQTGKSKEVEIEYRGKGVLNAKQVERKSAHLKQVRIE